MVAGAESCVSANSEFDEYCTNLLAESEETAKTDEHVAQCDGSAPEKEWDMTSENFGNGGFNSEQGQDPQESQQGHPGPGSQSEFGEQDTGGQPQGDRGGVGGLDGQQAGRPEGDGLGDGQDRRRLEESEDEGFGGTQQPETD